MTPRIRAALLLALVFVVAAPRFRAASPDIVISQVYGGGGNAARPTPTISSSSTTAARLPSTSPAGRSSTRRRGRDVADDAALRDHRARQVFPGPGGGRHRRHRLRCRRPTPSARFPMSATAGKVRWSARRLGADGRVPDRRRHRRLRWIRNAANCSERSAAPALTNTTAALRLQGGQTTPTATRPTSSKALPTPRNSGSATVALSGDRLGHTGGGPAGRRYAPDGRRHAGHHPASTAITVAGRPLGDLRKPRHRPGVHRRRHRRRRHTPATTSSRSP